MEQPLDDSAREKLARMDERLQHLERKLGNGSDPYFTPKAEFQPVRAVVYGMLAVILTGFIGALVALVMLHGK
jgi:hypothetical protein